MERAHSVENFVLNPTNNLLLSAGGETIIAQYDGLGSSSSPIVAPAFVGLRTFGGILGGET